MASILINGGNELNGSLPISGAKNAALPLMIASLLTADPLQLENVPHLEDVRQLRKIIENHGPSVTDVDSATAPGSLEGQTINFHAAEITDTCAPYELVSKMRASFWVIGPLLARMHECKVSLPGGCAIGTRPVDFYLDGLRTLGAKIDNVNGYVLAKAPKGGLVGARVKFPKVSVGATHVVLMASTLAKGTTIIENAAREPEISDVAKCLVAMGAKISGIGTSTLTIQGVDALHGATHRVVADRIETGTYAMAVAMTGGDVLLKGGNYDHLAVALDVLRQTGADVAAEADGIRVSRDKHTPITAQNIETEVFPGFPTDLQAQFMALMATARGNSIVRETIFENRFMHVPELVRMGASIKIDGQYAKIVGVKELRGAEVMATDLRASASLIMAGLIASGQTRVNRIYHLDRGFDRLAEKLAGCGANVERIESST